MRSFSQTLHFLKMRRLRHHRGGILPSGPHNWPLIAQEPTWGPWISSYTVVLALLPIQEKSKKASLYNELSASDFLLLHLNSYHYLCGVHVSVSKSINTGEIFLSLKCAQIWNFLSTNMMVQVGNPTHTWRHMMGHSQMQVHHLQAKVYKEYMKHTWISCVKIPHSVCANIPKSRKKNLKFQTLLISSCLDKE